MSSIYAVAGSPVFHSRSPAMFNVALRELGLDAVYVRLAASSAEEAVETARDIGMAGLNITSPFKTGIIRYLDEVDQDAQKTASVNTVVQKQGTLIGYNTDIEGVAAALRSAGFDPSDKRAVVLGAGGAARAAAFALVSAGAHVVMVNRTFEKALHSARELGCGAMPMDRIREALRNTHLLLSAVSTNERLIDPKLLPPRLTVLDANYGRPTALVRDAAAAGCKVVDGREWLLAQAIPAFRHFTGKTPPAEKMRKVLFKPKGDGRRNIALIGFMGTGKSTVAGKLAALTGMTVVDIDRRVEEKAGCSIAEIFGKYGEGRFRAMEQAEIDAVRLDSEQIVACGGGAVLNKANVRVLRNNCLSVWLWANVRTALNRVGSTATRPLLDGPDAEQRARATLAARTFHYAATSDLLISTEGKGPEEIAERIWNEVGHSFTG